MVSSHGLYKKKDISGCEIVDLGAEIELFGAQLFKKKNRFHPRLIH